jgi:xanthine dehydrogenase accessory factor
MVIGADGTLAGSVSGGCVEAAVIDAAEAVLRGGPPQLLSFAGFDAIDAGLPCGGELDVWIQEHRDTALKRRIAKRLAAVEVTALTGYRAGAKLVVGEDGAVDGTLGDAALDLQATTTARRSFPLGLSIRRGELFYDVCVPAPELMIVGAVDLSVSLSKLASTAGWDTTIIDPRARYAGRERFPAADRVIVAWPSRAFALLGGVPADASIVAVSHDPKLDDDALGAALRSPARFIGAMGSRASHLERCQRLRAAGLGGELGRLAAPLGLDLGATSVEETALSILAEVVAASHGRGGGRLREAIGPIHGSSSTRRGTAAA